jgi:uncharacterized protein YneF (UPF0154 family)
MTEARAVALLIAGAVLGMFAALTVLQSMHASNQLMVLVFALALVVGSYLSARVAVHYSEEDPPDRH